MKGNDNNNGHYFLNTAVVYFENRKPTHEQIARFHEAIKKAAKRAGFCFEFLLFQDNPAQVIKLMDFKMAAIARGYPEEGSHSFDIREIMLMRELLK